ncbi:hypothetical protein [Rhizobium sp. P44RR-XXIV]|uniref:hypothetical protein n=1 Tax=Rhizobium sp. P44RR-XXIV TaxID=1921145 RepID=UPI0009853A4C|nr:hypothetical protein [Rhizobium sp. P44RR-XXIV]TIX89182.1 hypothetical protein BSK43_021490 [Rhizobium sp. P44RR-XXIV]
MGVIRDKAKLVYAAGPSGDPTEPDKTEIIDLNGVIEDAVTGAGADLVRATTLGGLTAGTRVGQPGQVTQGADKGEYTWNGSAWIRTGDLIDAAALEASDATQQQDIDAANARLDALDQSMPTDIYAGHNIVAAVTTADGTVIAQILDDGSAVSGKTVDQIIDPDTIGGLVDNAFGGAVVVGADGKVRVRGLYNSTGLPCFAHVVNYGQSNAGGADALPVVSGADQLLGAIKPIMGVQTWRDFVYSTTPTARGAGWLHPVDLFEANDGFSRGETYSTGIAGQLKAGGSGGRFSSSQKERGSKIYFTNPTAGGRYLSELIPSGTYGHYATFLDDMAKAKAWAAAMGLEYGLAGIAFCQGEAEGGNMKMSASGPTLNFADLVSQWSAMLIALRSQMEIDAKALGAVNRNLPMFLAQTMAYATGEAQATAAHSDQNVILAGPTYYAPTAINSTIVPNGRASTEITFAGDISAITAPLLREGAFYLKTSGVAMTIRDVRLSGGNTIMRGETAENIGTPATGVVMELHRPGGGGNVCDSDDTISVFNFEGANTGRVGTPYPLNNFARIHASAIET